MYHTHTYNDIGPNQISATPSSSSLSAAACLLFEVQREGEGGGEGEGEGCLWSWGQGQWLPGDSFLFFSLLLAGCELWLWAMPAVSYAGCGLCWV